MTKPQNTTPEKRRVYWQTLLPALPISKTDHHKYIGIQTDQGRFIAHIVYDRFIGGRVATLVASAPRLFYKLRDLLIALDKGNQEMIDDAREAAWDAIQATNRSADELAYVEADPDAVGEGHEQDRPPAPPKKPRTPRKRKKASAETEPPAVDAIDEIKAL
jgi:hypothetical protein